MGELIHLLEGVPDLLRGQGELITVSIVHDRPSRHVRRRQSPGNRHPPGRSADAGPSHGLLAARHICHYGEGPAKGSFGLSTEGSVSARRRILTPFARPRPSAAQSDGRRETRAQSSVLGATPARGTREGEIAESALTSVARISEGPKTEGVRRPPLVEARIRELSRSIDPMRKIPPQRSLHPSRS